MEIHRGWYTKAYKCKLQKNICKACMLCIYKVGIWIKAISFGTQRAIKEAFSGCLVALSCRGRGGGGKGEGETCEEQWNDIFQVYIVRTSYKYTGVSKSTYVGSCLYGR